MTKLQTISDCVRILKSDYIQPHQQAWKVKAQEKLDKVLDSLPSGSGIDNGTKIDFDKSSEDKIVLEVGFHHMNDHGYYIGWTHHVLTVTPSFNFGPNIKIAGPNKNQIKDYLGEVYLHALQENEASSEYLAATSN